MAEAGINMLHKHYYLKAMYFPVHHQPCMLPLMERSRSCRPEKEESKNVSEAKPNIEGAKKFRRPTRAAGPTKKEFVTKVLGLESHTPLTLETRNMQQNTRKRSMPLPTTSRGSTKVGQTS